MGHYQAGSLDIGYLVDRHGVCDRPERLQHRGWKWADFATSLYWMAECLHPRVFHHSNWVEVTGHDARWFHSLGCSYRLLEVFALAIFDCWQCLDL